MDEEQAEFDSVMVRMIEAFDGNVRHRFDDGLYIHSGDLFEVLEGDRQACEDQTEFKAQETVEKIIAQFQTIILRRTGS